jgi:predicted  nucleic acid-binding Zn-ribbon protein
MPSLSQLKSMTAQLVTRLTARIAESETLSAELTELKDQAEKLQTDLSATSTSLEQSTQDLARLQSSFDAYILKANYDLKIMQGQRDAAIVIAKLNGLYFKISLGVVGAVAIYEGGRALKFWR